MEIKDFIEKFAEAIEIENPQSLNEETDFHNLDEWSSLAALSIIAMIDEEFGVTVSGTEMRSCETISDLFAIVSNK